MPINDSLVPAQLDGGIDHSPEELRKASLYLSASNLHGVGHHSSVYRARFVPPMPLTTNSRSSNGQVTVIAKTAFPSARPRSLLENEAGIMNSLSDHKHRHMQQEWCGLNVIRGLNNPVPVGPIVPKFYGYYRPEHQTSSDYELSPIMLIEDCGNPVEAGQLGPNAK